MRRLQGSACPVRITGATGPQANLVNGVYENMTSWRSSTKGRPGILFRKFGDPKTCLAFWFDDCDPRTLWSVCEIGGDDEMVCTMGKKGWAHSLEGSALPQGTTAWAMSKDGKYEEQPLSVSRVTAEV